MGAKTLFVNSRMDKGRSPQSVQENQSDLRRTEQQGGIQKGKPKRLGLLRRPSKGRCRWGDKKAPRDFC